MTELRTVLALGPHPDDETFFLGGTLKQFSDGGMDTHVALITYGDKGVQAHVDPTTGAITTARPDDVQQYVEERKAEFAAATRELGVRGVSLLGFPDKGIDSSVVDTLIDVILRVNPHIILSFSEAGSTLHPDHTATAYGLYSALIEILSNPDFTDQLNLEMVLTSFLPHDVRTCLSKWSEVDHPDILDINVESVRDSKRRAAYQYRSQAHLVNAFDQAGAFDQPGELYHRRITRSRHTGNIQVLGLHVQPKDIPFVLDPASYTSSHKDLASELVARLDAFGAPKVMQVAPRVLTNVTTNVSL